MEYRWGQKGWVRVYLVLSFRGDIDFVGAARATVCDKKKEHEEVVQVKIVDIKRTAVLAISEYREEVSWRERFDIRPIGLPSTYSVPRNSIMQLQGSSRSSLCGLPMQLVVSRESP